MGVSGEIKVSGIVGGEGRDGKVKREKLKECKRRSDPRYVEGNEEVG